MSIRLLAVAVVLAIASAVLVSQVPPAPPAAIDHSQEAFIIEQSRVAYRFENDGTGRREAYMRIKMQSEAGVQQWGQLPLGYNAATERIEILFVRVRKADGTIVTVPPDAVQDLSSPVQSVAPVYTDFRQKHVTVPSLRPGETLEFSTVTSVHMPLARDHFWTEYDFQRQGINFDERFEVDIPAGRRVILRTAPDAEPTVSEADGRRIYRWAKSRLAHPPKDKEAASKDDPGGEDAPRAAVRLTTFQDWAEVGRWYASLEKEPRAATEAIRAKAAEIVKGKTSDVEKLEALYDFVAQNFRYVSISLGAGRYQPRAAADVLRDQYGDCKDKHTLLASLIGTVGLRASTVLIGSATKLDRDFPSPSQFDHVITRAGAGQASVWLDVTTEVAPFRLLLPNLRKKQALVIPDDGAPAYLDDTPADPPMMNVEVREVDGMLGERGKLSGRVRIAIRGDAELWMRVVFRRTPAAQWKEIVKKLSEAFGTGEEIGEFKVSDPVATRQPFEITYQVSKANFVDSTAKKVEMRLPLADFDLPSQPDASKSIELGSPGRVEYRIRLQLDATYQARVPVPVAMERDYGVYRASYKLDGDVFSGDRTLELRANTLPADRGGDFAAFTRVVTADNKQGLALTIASTASLGAVPDVTAPELNRLAAEASQSGDYARMIALLKRLLELDPKDRTAWGRLGWAHAALRQFEPAVEAYRKQIDLNPYDQFVYNNLGFVYLRQRQYVDAEASFKKQLEINPLDSFAHSSLGQVYIDTHRYAEAAAALDKAVSLAADNAELHVALGTAYLNLDKSEAALASFDRAVELSPQPFTWNNIAYQLSLKGAHLGRAQQYAESAVAAVTAESRNFTIGHITSRELSLVSSLAANWDTLGWVLFAKGDVAGAEKFVSAAWALAQHAEVGDHLAQIYERQGRRDEALRMYATALSGDRPTEYTRKRLVALGGSTVNVDELVRSQKETFTRMRTLKIDADRPPSGTADVFVLIGAGSRIEDIRFVEGDEQLRGLTDALKAAQLDRAFPDDSQAKILRRGTMKCAAQCTFVLMPAGEARPPR